MKYIPFEAGQYYHIYNRGNNDEKIFYEADNYTYFIRLLKKHLTPILEIYTYCLLPNHFHLVVKFKEINNLPESIRIGKTKLHQGLSNLFNAYSKSINKRYSRRGSLFQEHLKRNQITDNNYFLNLIIYVNTNSSHHGLRDFENYPYSSYQQLISKSPTFLNREEVLELFDGKDNFIFTHLEKQLNINLLNNIELE
jgi:REP element-mobilizing transposase RayT